MYSGAPSGGIAIGGGGGGVGRGGGRTWSSTTSVSTSGKRIQKEMTELSMEAPPDCAAGPKGDNLYHWVATLFGPPGNFCLNSDKNLIFLFFSRVSYFNYHLFFFRI